jgi:hypothetical protein
MLSSASVVANMKTIPTAEPFLKFMSDLELLIQHRTLFWRQHVSQLVRLMDTTPQLSPRHTWEIQTKFYVLIVNRLFG